VALVAAGVPAAEALASATSGAARACGLGGRKGRLRAGYDADLLLVNGDPLADVSALRRVAGVMLRGTMADPAQPLAQAGVRAQVDRRSRGEHPDSAARWWERLLLPAVPLRRRGMPDADGQRGDAELAGDRGLAGTSGEQLAGGADGPPSEASNKPCQGIPESAQGSRSARSTRKLSSTLRTKRCQR
jgi:hypothetical protein